MKTARRMSGRSSSSAAGPSKRTSPFSMNTARSASWSAMLTDCSTITIVEPRSWISRTTSRSAPTMVGAKPRDNSSIITSSGRVISAMPRASICCSPPDRSPAIWLRRWPRIGKSSSTSSRASSMRSWSSLMSHVARRRFSSTERVGNTPLPPGISEIPWRAVMSADVLVMSSPLKVTVPAVGRTRPQMPFSNVDFPAPLVPRSATISPSMTSKSTPKRICTGP